MNQPAGIGIIGGGISGLAAAWTLMDRYPVTLIEREPRLGGHARTYEISAGEDAGTPVDIGFIVLNDRNYPTLHKLFQDWDVPIQDSDMSFGFLDEASGFYYSSDLPAGLFARRRNLVSPVFWQVLRDIYRFNRLGRQALATGVPPGQTLGGFISQHGFSRYFVNFHLLPVAAAIWSTPAEEITAFPAESLLRFFDHHGLLEMDNRPRWQTVTGGSREYVRAFERRFRGTVIKGNGARRVSRQPEGIRVDLMDGSSCCFHDVILATHADITLALLENPAAEETRLLGAWTYTANRVDLHTGIRLLPPKRSAWASWNYFRPAGGHDGKMSLSYYMNRLQSLATRQHYLVTLNGSPWIDPAEVLESVVFDHPCYNFSSVASQPELDRLSGQDRLWFCGAYHGYGFHEDGARSGIQVARRLRERT